MEVIWLALAFVVWVVVVPVIIYVGATMLGNALRAMQNFFND